MKNFFTKIIRFIKYKQSCNIQLDILYDYIAQLETLYKYTKSKKYKTSQRDLLNLKMAEVRYNIYNHLKNFVC